MGESGVHVGTRGGRGESSGAAHARCVLSPPQHRPLLSRSGFWELVYAPLPPGAGLFLIPSLPSEALRPEPVRASFDSRAQQFPLEPRAGP